MNIITTILVNIKIEIMKILSYYIFEIWCAFYISQLRVAPCQVYNSHMQLMATILDNVGLSHFGNLWRLKKKQKGDNKTGYLVFGLFIMADWGMTKSVDLSVSPLFL